MLRSVTRNKSQEVLVNVQLWRNLVIKVLFKSVKWREEVEVQDYISWGLTFSEVLVCLSGFGFNVWVGFSQTSSYEVCISIL